VTKTLHLSEREKEQIKGLIDAGQPLPARYRAVLFADPPEAELIWPGKTSEVTNVVLPFQTIEQIDEPRAEAGAHHVADLFDFDATTGRQSGGWINKLIWGDNKLVLAALKNGPLRREIEQAGGLKLVYIDPPFDVGADFSYVLSVQGEDLVKTPSVIEEIAYRDTWGRGQDSYFSMLYERLCLIHGLLAENGSVYVHCDWRINSGIRMVLDEIFGASNFRNEIVWWYTNKLPTGGDVFDRQHDIILWFRRGEAHIFNEQALPIPPEKQQYQARTRKVGGKREYIRDDAGSIVYEMVQEKLLPDVWNIPLVHPIGNERTGYPTQKPEQLLEKIVTASSNEGDLVADFFSGSGTCLAVAEKLGRKWIGCDLSRYGIHISRKRLIDVQRELKAAAGPYRSFEILNLGKYERQYFAGIDPTLPEEQRRVLSIQKEEQYLTLILTAYRAERILQTPPFHGRKGGALVLVGPVDAPITWSDVNQSIETCQKMRVTRCDLLGFEFEMGLLPHAQDEARAKGVSLALRYIPKDVFDKRAVEKGQVVFYDVAYVEVQPIVTGRSVRVKLTDFGVYYRQEDVDALVASLKNGASKVTVEAGRVVKITKDKSGVVSRDVLTKVWTDWIDYWAVDFDFESRPETIRIMMPDASGELRERTQWTGGYIFENEWQSFRTRRNRSLELESAAHEYPNKGRYKIAVKVIDIFGNDTTKVVGVTV
jgi:DNA modification methylase